MAVEFQSKKAEVINKLCSKPDWEVFINKLRANGGNIAATARYFGVSYELVRRRRLEYSEFNELVLGVKEEILDYMEYLLLDQARRGNTQAMMFYLKNLGRHRGYE